MRPTLASARVVHQTAYHTNQIDVQLQYAREPWRLYFKCTTRWSTDARTKSILDFYYNSTNLIAKHHLRWVLQCDIIGWHQGSLQSAKHGPINGARKSLYKCIRTKAKCMFLEATCLREQITFGWWPFVHNLGRHGHGHAPAQRHKHRRLSTQQTHFVAGDKTVNYNKKRQILNTLTKTRTIFIYLEIRERLNLYPNWMFSWLHCHVVSLITLVFHWSRSVFFCLFNCQGNSFSFIYFF